MSTMNESVITTEKRTEEEKSGVFTRRSPSPNGREREPKVKVETEPAGPPKSVIREYFESAVVTVIMALFGMTFIVQAVKVPTGSMQNTITVGDHLLVNKFIFAPGPRLPFLPQREIKRGDIIVFKYPGNPNDPAGDLRPDNIPFKTNYVKRVIGIPGDRVKIVDQQVYLNDKRLNEPYVARDPAAPYDPFRDNFPPRNEQFLQANMQPEWADQILSNVHDGELVVPPDKYFAMGDNRDHSWDSRFWGFVDRDAIMGRPVVIYWSVQGARDDEADRGVNSWLLNFLDTIIHLPSRTRWSGEAASRRASAWANTG